MYKKLEENWFSVTKDLEQFKKVYNDSVIWVQSAMNSIETILNYFEKQKKENSNLELLLVEKNWLKLFLTFDWELFSSVWRPYSTSIPVFVTWEESLKALKELFSIVNLYLRWVIFQSSVDEYIVVSKDMIEETLKDLKVFSKEETLWVQLHFKSFEDYLSSLKQWVRYKLNKSKKNFDEKNYKLEHKKFWDVWFEEAFQESIDKNTLVFKQKEIFRIEKETWKELSYEEKEKVIWHWCFIDKEWNESMTSKCIKSLKEKIEVLTVRGLNWEHISSVFYVVLNDNRILIKSSWFINWANETEKDSMAQKMIFYFYFKRMIEERVDFVEMMSYSWNWYKADLWATSYWTIYYLKN